MRIIFAGTPQFAADHLEYLLAKLEQITSHCSVIGVYTQPDRRAGRGKKFLPSPVKQVALQHDIPIFQPASLKDPASLAELKRLDADIMVVAAYGLILPSSVLDAPRFGCINIHASLLPRWRGAAPVERSIIAGDKLTGITIMQMDEGLDTGDMLLKDQCTIAEDETGDSLREKLTQIGKPLLITALRQINASQQQPEQQNDSESNYAEKLNKNEGEIDWRESADLIARKIRAFTSALSSFSTINTERIRITRACAGSQFVDSTAAPGELLAVQDGCLHICCGVNGSEITSSEALASGAARHTVLLIKEVQMPGKKPMSIKALLNGRPDLFPTGSQFNLPDRTAQIC